MVQKLEIIRRGMLYDVGLGVANQRFNERLESPFYAETSLVEKRTHCYKLLSTDCSPSIPNPPKMYVFFSWCKKLYPSLGGTRVKAGAVPDNPIAPSCFAEPASDADRQNKKL